MFPENGRSSCHFARVLTQGEAQPFGFLFCNEVVGGSKRSSKTANLAAQLTRVARYRGTGWLLLLVWLYETDGTGWLFAFERREREALQEYIYGHAQYSVMFYGGAIRNQLFFCNHWKSFFVFCKIVLVYSIEL